MSIEEIMKKAQQAAEVKKQQDEQGKVSGSVEKVYADREKQVSLEQERQEAEDRKEKLVEQKQKDLDRIEALHKELGVADKTLEEAVVAEQQIQSMDIPKEEKEKLISELQAEAGKITSPKKEKEGYIATTEASVAEAEVGEKEAGSTQEQKLEDIKNINKETITTLNDPKYKDEEGFSKILTKIHEDALKQNDKEKINARKEELTAQLEKLRREIQEADKAESEALQEKMQADYKMDHWKQSVGWDEKFSDFDYIRLDLTTRKKYEDLKKLKNASQNKFEEKSHQKVVLRTQEAAMEKELEQLNQPI